MPDTEDAAEKNSNLISHFVIHSTEDRLNTELHGRLAKILGPTGLFPIMRIAVSGVLLVAREGVEPPTPGL
jgi:ribosomal protein L1